MYTGHPVPLDRNFSAIPPSARDSDEQKILAAWGLRQFKQWAQIDEGHRSVILGEAGAGKTYEMHARAKYMEEQGRAAFFIRIEDIKQDFEQAFEVGSAEAFKQWLGSKNEAWFYLDSVDEARLGNPRDFKKAIRLFSREIKDAQMRAHVCISSRPYAWRAKSDRDLIEHCLPFKKPRTEWKGEDSESAGRTADPESVLEIYSLCALDEDQIRQFAVHRSTPEVDRLIDKLKQLNLLDLAGRPFDLEVILAQWTSKQSISGRSELLRYNIETKLKESDPDRETRQPLSLDKAREGARRLAAAVILTGESGIRVPDNTCEQAGIDARSVLADWDPNDIQTLLQRAVFDDIIYGAVRFRHREARELLAAEWFWS